MSIEKIIRLPRLTEIVSLSPTTIWRREKLGEFPKRIKIGIRCVGWLESEINEWIMQQANRGVSV